MNNLDSCVNNERTNHRYVFASANRRNTCASLYTYMKLFKIFGIHMIHLKYKQQKISDAVCITKNLTRISYTLFLYLMISEAFLRFKSNESAKEVLVISALLGGSYLMWKNIMKHEEYIYNVIRKL